LPGLFSAYGLLAADVRVSRSRTLVAPLDATLRPALAAAFDELNAGADRELIAQGVAPNDRIFTRELDVRYAGQSFELTVPFESLDATAAGFHDRHERRYGYAARDESLEIVTVRVTAVGRTVKPRLERSPDATEEPGDPKTDALLETRAVHDGTRFATTAVFARERLHTGAVVAGPAVIEQYDSTTFVAPGWTARVDALGNLRLASDTE
jgi:N-methylhydantoinase A